MLYETCAFDPTPRTIRDTADLVLVAVAKLTSHHLVAPQAPFPPFHRQVKLPLRGRRTRLLVEQVDAVRLIGRGRSREAQWMGTHDKIVP